MSTERGDILRAARGLTEGDRNEEYGDPVDQLGLAGELKELVRDRMLRDVPPAEMEALDMVLTKLSRAVMGGKPGRDTYVDMAAYAAIAGEAALRDEEERKHYEEEAEAMLGGVDRSPHSWWRNNVHPELDEADKAEIRRRGPGDVVADSVNDATTGVGPLTGRPHNVYEGEQVAQDVADQKRREAERNSAGYTDLVDRGEHYSQKLAKAEGKL